MKISRIAELLHAEVVSGMDLLDNDVHSACGSDMMRDVLVFVKDQAGRLTGLVRDKEPTFDVIDLAEECGIVLLTTEERMYAACGKLYAAGLTGGSVLPK